MRPTSTAWLLGSALLATAFTSVVSVLDQLGLQEAEAKKFVLNNVTGNFSLRKEANFKANEFLLPRPQALSAVVRGDKAAAARELCAWVRSYTESQEFITAYTEVRQKLQPAPSVNTLRPDEETINMTRESLQSMERELVSMKKNKATPAASVQAIQSQVDQQRAMLAAWEDPDPAMSNWARQYPADPKVLIRRRLKEYLDLVATVDFNAQLTAPDRYGTRKFVRPEYEGKDNRWKAVYRAGREVNTVMTAFARQWMSGTGAPTAAKKTGKP